MTGDSKNCKQAAFLVEDLEFFKRDGGGGGGVDESTFSYCKLTILQKESQ